jgi:hypothetical protein
MDISKLTAEEKAELHRQLLSEQKETSEKIKETKATYKELAEEFVNRNIDSLVHHKDITGFLIDKTIEDFKPIKVLKSEVYGIKSQDSHTSTLKDGSASITVGQNVIIKFDGTESAGVEKIKEYMKSLSGDNENAIKLGKIIDKKLKVNQKTGFLNPSAIIDLASLQEEFNSELFSEGLKIITEAQVRTVTTKYVSGYKIEPINEDRTKRLEFRITI